MSESYPVETALGADPGKITVINNGIELERFQPSVKPERVPVIGCFARVVPIKGLTVLIKAAKIVLEKRLPKGLRASRAEE